MSLISIIDFWGGLDKWVKRLVVVGGAITLLSQFSGAILSITLDNHYVLAAEAKAYVTTVELNRQIGDVKKIQLESERRRLRDELYKLKSMNRPQDRQRILQLEDDIKDIDRQLRRLEQGR